MMQAVLTSVAYVAAQMLADVTSLRIVRVAGFSVDAGTFVYPFTFTLRDLVHKTAGIRVARALIAAAALVNLVMALLFWWVSRLPPDPSVGPQVEFGRVLSPVWRIVLASIVAEVLSELLDTEYYAWWVRHVTSKYQWSRVLTSNAISIPVDSLVFCWVAFGGTMPHATVWSIVLSNVIVKGLTTLVSLPAIYAVRESGRS